MIDNVVNIINGLQNKADPARLLELAHPMGYIEELKQLVQMENPDYGLIYYTVLTDTPLSKYFDKYIERMQERYKLQDIDEVFEKMNQSDSKVLRMLLKKLWIEDFHS